MQIDVIALSPSNRDTDNSVHKLLTTQVNKLIVALQLTQKKTVTNVI